MNTILLRSDGSLEDNRKAVAKEPLKYLSAGIELESGYTLRSFFRMLQHYPELPVLNEFSGQLLEQVGQSPSSGCEYPGIDCLEMGKTVEMIGFPGKPRLEIYATFQGRCGDDLNEIRSIRVEHLLDLPVSLGRLRHVIFGDKMDLLEFETVYNLFEFMEAIIWELSFHGTPAQCNI
ncbi:MAG: hypothetical protein GY697_24815 [Desulfobacterales bacterium]|nr:hypothetical protein [Desulfobacterales bacterium]